MKKRFTSLLLLFFLVPVCLKAQNLVPNGNFEYYSACPNTYTQTNRCIGWRQYTAGTTDYFNTCAPTTSPVYVPLNSVGWQAPASGNGYMGTVSFVNIPGITNDYTEYLSASITPMQVGMTYKVSMFVSLADGVAYGHNGLGVYFFDNGPDSLTSATSYTTLPVTPQVSFSNYGVIMDMINWTKLEALFTADSAYDHIVIGKFIPPSGIITAYTGASSTTFSYYYIDSVEVKRVKSITCLYADSLICAGDIFYVPYKTNYTSPFLTGNIFKVQLSDVNGSFNNGTIIGIGTNAFSGSIKCTIAPTIIPGNKYRLRILSTNLIDSSNDNGKDIAISIYPQSLKLSSNSPVCINDSIFLSATSATNNVNYNWVGPNNFISAKQSNSFISSINSKGVYSLIASVYHCQIKDSIKISVIPYPENLTINNNSPVCINDELKITASTTSQHVSYKWLGPNNFNSNDSVIRIKPFTYKDTGMYVVSATIEKCTVTDTTYARIIADPPLELGNNALLCNGESRLLSPNIPGATYKWQDGSTADHYDVSKAGTYWVEATTVCNVFSDSVKIDYELCDCKPLVASAFTPNNDGLNDKLGAHIDCTYSDYKFEIVNQFGQAVFVSTNAHEKWDGSFKGEPPEVGTYFYLLQLKGPRNKDFQFKGDIVLIR
ncbi:MAG: gliding motility-associated C-terminal domain-containing protein [Bacteroidetes bacterium]|nr:gliding motility-associated C-terminal domain-containing protein [Bacteroidota bacterium]